MLLKVENIHTYYGFSYILQGISLEVEEGEAVALLGRRSKKGNSRAQTAHAGDSSFKMTLGVDGAARHYIRLITPAA